MTRSDDGKAQDLEADPQEQQDPGPEDEGARVDVEEGEPQDKAGEDEAPDAGEEQPAPRPPTSLLSLAINKLLSEQSRAQDRLLRTAAEFENFKKRSRRERSERVKQAEDHIVLEFLPVVDNLERALSHGGGDSDGALVDGVEMVHKQFLSVLERYGITPFDTLGQTFDPEFHEAVQQMHSEVPAGAVCQELQRGYRREDRLVRAALVVVSKGPEEDPRDTAETTEVQRVDQQDPEEATATVELKRPPQMDVEPDAGPDAEPDPQQAEAQSPADEQPAEPEDEQEGGA